MVIIPCLHTIIIIINTLLTRTPWQRMCGDGLYVARGVGSREVFSREREQLSCNMLIPTDSLCERVVPTL